MFTCHRYVKYNSGGFCSSSLRPGQVDFVLQCFICINTYSIGYCVIWLFEVEGHELTQSCMTELGGPCMACGLSSLKHDNTA